MAITEPMAIRMQCTLCHDLPQVSVEGNVKTVASTVAPGLTPPDSHNEPNWMHEHRSKVDESCAMCHGPIKWGSEGGSFCSNPACHGRKWPGMDLNAERAKAATPAAPAAAAAPTKAAKAAGKTAADASRKASGK